MAAAENNKTRTSAGGALRILQITDTHLFGDVAGRLVGMNTEETSLEVLEKVLGGYLPADLILATGDIVHDGSVQAYQRFKSRFEALGVRTLVIPGNHDKPELLNEVMQGGLVTADPHLVMGRWQFVMLDSTVRGWDGGRLAPDQLELLDRCLSAEPERHAVVCLHHHPVRIGSDWIDPIGVDNADEFFRVIDRHAHVRAIVWGHIHQDYSGWRKGVKLMASPSTCIQFKPGQRDFALDDISPGFRWIELHDDGRIESAVVRAEERMREVDLESSGYS